MNKHVKIINQKEVFNYKIFRVVEAELQHELYSGKMSDPITRLSLDRGDSVAMLVHNPESNTIVMTEQFRYPTYKADNEGKSGWLMEIPAGTVEAGEDPNDAVNREVLEETGYEVTEVQHISTFYLSPGGTSERIILYYARVNPKQRLHAGGGVEAEGENIRVLEMEFQDVFQQIATGQISDAKTIIALQWLQIKHLT